MLTRSTAAQISPGPLARVHQRIEGAGECQKCHERGHGVAAERCLECHVVIRARVRADAGLHRLPEYRSCERCHIDHQGREFELIWWGDGGVDAFDHETTGHPLEDAHAELECRQCHKSELIRDRRRLVTLGKALDRTYLGLGTGCEACHAGPHQDQFPGRSCDECHDQRAFAPAGRFDHSTAAFVLSGKHASVECAKCHPTVGTVGDWPSVRYSGIEFASCTACHEDHHQGRLGPRCESCHSTADWKRVDQQRFDHSVTAFPLTGKHVAVTCEECHGHGVKVPRPEADRCAACHVDAHVGQLRGSDSAGECESCHDVKGFEPSRFDVDRHRDTEYALEGRHAEIECRECHASTPVAELARWIPADVEVSAGQAALRFRFDSTECLACHSDVHDATSSEILRGMSCETCHDLSGWSSVAFVHSLTGYEIRDGHRGLECTSCHRYEIGVERVSFAGLSRACEECHDDPHVAQFADADGGSRCERCHRDAVWAASEFDHSADSRYPLEGAHAGVACDKCHPTERIAGREVVRYKPLDASCAACHGEYGVKPGDGRWR